MEIEAIVLLLISSKVSDLIPMPHDAFSADIRKGDNFREQRGEQETMISETLVLNIGGPIKPSHADSHRIFDLFASVGPRLRHRCVIWRDELDNTPY